MFDTKTRVKNRTNWGAAGGPKIEVCDLAYSIMETPFKRDIVKELCDEAHKQGIKVDLYFSHPDWYDADFRPYAQHPLQVQSSQSLMVPWDYQRVQTLFRDHVGWRPIQAKPKSRHDEPSSTTDRVPTMAPT
jgi:hypothetical protein